MKRWVLSALVGVTALSFSNADPAPQWRDYDNTLVGVHLKINHDWQEIDIKETKVSGTAAFNLSPHTTISIVRQQWDQPFDVWISSPILTQIFQPGYQVARTEFAGRKSNLVTGVALDGRRQESYYSSEPPFLDEITFTAPDDEWTTYREAIATVKKTIHWTR